ncbi:MAG: hypothetical protein AB1428_13525 [Bacteroidota bacterium]
MKLGLAVFTLPILLLLKSLLYWAAFRFRKLGVSYWTSMLIAGGPLALWIVLPFVPIPLPYFLDVAIGIGFAVYLAMKYGSVPLFPDAVVICLGVEVVTIVAFGVIGSTILRM